MEYVRPPRGAMNLLAFFANDPDFDTVLGDLSEEFQQQVTAFGQATARRWYWRETLRNTRVFAHRELRRTPLVVLATTVFILGSVWLAELAGIRLLENVQWAWVPPRFWGSYREGAVLLFATLTWFGAGALAACFLKAREISAIVAFAGLLICLAVYTVATLIRNTVQWRLAAHLSVLQVSGQMLIFGVLAVLFYSFGCLWTRWHRLSARPPLLSR